MPFDDGITQTVAWYAANRAWWEPIKSGAWDDYYRAQYGWRLEQSTEA
jgi:dTDP-glucose 4,6-dehydratase